CPQRRNRRTNTKTHQIHHIGDHAGGSHGGQRSLKRGVRTSVAAELDWDPKVDSRDIKVTANGGGATLRGTVGSLRHVREAQNATQRVYGVTSVSNLLTVRPMTSGHAEDREVRTAVLHALMLNSSIPATINAQVELGVVRLAGTATWNW